MSVETTSHTSQPSVTESLQQVAEEYAKGNLFDQSAESAEDARFVAGEHEIVDTGRKVETHEKVLGEVVTIAESAKERAEEANGRIDAMEKQLELLNRERELRANLESRGGLADTQPRRVRSANGVTEKLVKYADGSFDWQIVSVDTKGNDTATEVARRSGAEVVVDDTVHAELIDDEPATDIEPRDDDIIDGEVVDDDPKPGKEIERFQPNQAPPVDIGELQAIEAAPVRKAIEAPKPPEETEVIEASKPEFVASSESYQQVLEAMDKYAEITAGKRNGYLGHFLEKSKWLVKIPGMQKLGDWANDRHDAKVREARADYETAARGMLDELKQFQAEQEVEDSKERQAEVRAEKLKLLTDMDTALEGKIVAEQLEKSGKGAITQKFVDWWVKQEGLGWKGDLKKFLAVAGVGAAAGLAVGAFGLSLPGLAVGALAGGVAGGGLMANVTKRRAGGITESGKTLADVRSEADIEAKRLAVEDIDVDELDVSHFTNIIEDRTRDEQIRNRARVNKGKGAGALGGGAGSALGGAINQAVNGIVNAQPPHAVNVAPPSEGPAVEVPKAPEFQGLNFDVQDGSGYTQELMDFAQANGHALTPDQSWQLHQDLMNQFGQDYINVNGGGNDIYVDAGDVRLAQPGSGQWAGGVPDFVKNWMAARNLW